MWHHTTPTDHGLNKLDTTLSTRGCFKCFLPSIVTMYFFFSIKPNFGSTQPTESWFLRLLKMLNIFSTFIILYKFNLDVSSNTPQGIMVWSKFNLHYTVLKNASKQVLGILAKWFLEIFLKLFLIYFYMYVKVQPLLILPCPTQC